MKAVVPKSVSEITPTWLSGVLHAGAFLASGDEVESVKAVGGVGDGLMGSIERLEVSYRIGDPDGPKTMLAKTPTIDPEVRKQLKPTRIYEREARFYAELAPRLSTRTPECYFAGTNPDEDVHLLLLEDLGHWEAGDELIGANEEQAKAAIRELAEMHAGTAGDVLDSLPWLPKLFWAPRKWYESSYARFCEMFEDTLNPLVRSGVGDRFAEFSGGIHAQFGEMPQALFHNDYRLDNLLFDGSGGVCVLDWQASCGGAAVLDLAFFLAVSLRPSDRRRLESMLLKTYLEVLHAGGYRAYDESGLLHDYRTGLLAVWQRIVVPAGSVADLSTERSRVLIETMTSRLQEALLDHNCASLLH